MSDIYAEHAPAVYRCLLAWTRNSALAEELTAETFYRAVVADQPVWAATARGYLVAIARNAMRKLQAKRSREEALVADVAAPYQSIEGLVDLQRTLAALYALPEDLREPLVLYSLPRFVSSSEGVALAMTAIPFLMLVLLLVGAVGGLVLIVRALR